ncbi:MAG: hypothetical protein WC775_06265 [Patescibacteria group bacterium]|jgi:hypothetical protein
MAKFHEYFEGKIEALFAENDLVWKRVGLFRKKAILRMRYFARCSLSGSTGFYLKIEIPQDVYEKLEIRKQISIHLGFDYEFSCFHIDKPIEVKVLEVVSVSDMFNNF